ncbi:cytochrome c3 family protein [Motiliproteus sediminis]|uniref:cytochrome c3 family protein n=1 Tax=Motiliproteus sediminis TaxID=1468178 RepID=UPI001AF024B2|nr:cytochrome c3 family protein [Motiliproteus sediminis]
MNRTGSFSTLSAALAGLLAVAYLASLPLGAAERRASDIRSTKHNLSNSGGQDVRSRTESNGGTEEVCVFCHTPHGASTSPGQPLWNRSDSAETNYDVYESSSLNAGSGAVPGITQPTEQSKLCLSCHDGTLAIGAIGNAPGSGKGQTYSDTSASGTYDVRIRMRHDSGPTPNTTVGTMADVPNVDTDTGSPSVDSLSGFTRNLGVDLSNDHPISFPYTTELAEADGELRDPDSESHIGTRSAGVRPIYPLTGDNMQCTTCHDPHVKGIDDPTGTANLSESNSKFLRGPRFQMSVPSGINFQQGVFDPSTGNAQSGDIVCLACHNRELDNQVWSTSVHADDTVADEVYTNEAADLRQFPRGIKVWQASCLNCHDTHSVSGSRRLLREGTDGSTNNDGAKSGGKAALEETCYQCHSNPSTLSVTFGGTGGSGIGTGFDGGIPNIRYEFESRTYHMPIVTSDQRNGKSGGTNEEVHDVRDADFSETGQNLGKGMLLNRHAECTDCHNPHRMQRNSRFNKDGVDDGQTASNLRTHIAGLSQSSDGANDGREGNVASGVLRGVWGVEPSDTFLGQALTSTWPQDMDEFDFEVRSGDPGTRTVAQADTNNNLTREYQLCFKCHSAYSQDMRNNTTFQTDIQLGSGNQGGSTNSGTNGLTYYTNVAAEFLSVKATTPATSNKDQGEVNGSGINPSAVNHRSWHPVVWPTGRTPAERGNTGFANIRPPFTNNVGTQTMYCSDCHGSEVSWSQGSGPNSSQVQGPHGSNRPFILKGDWDLGVTPNAASDNNNSAGTLCGRCHDPKSTSGFSGDTDASHNFSEKRTRPCMWCHVAIPHGWRNKAFLANLECVGPEGGRTNNCTTVGSNGHEKLAREPYYNNALLRIRTWKRSGDWRESNCGSTLSYSGRDWMEAACNVGSGPIN